jgi:hypothetical protein
MILSEVVFIFIYLFRAIFIQKNVAGRSAYSV